MEGLLERGWTGGRWLVDGGGEEGWKTKGMVPARAVVLVRAWGMEREVRCGRR